MRAGNPSSDGEAVSFAAGGRAHHGRRTVAQREGGEGARATRIVADHQQREQRGGVEADGRFGGERTRHASAEEFGEGGAGEAGGENDGEELEDVF